MKKILIIFFGLILGCNLASAKSVSCWKEYTSYYTTHTESFMKTALSGTTIVNVGIENTGVAMMYDNMGGGTYIYGISDFKVSGSLGSYNSYDYLTYTYRGYDSYGTVRTADLYSLGKIYHYCIVDEGSSGGGGGGATGSVNFIIKATS